MSNPWRGEVELHVDGQAYVLRLTLGALADLEHAMGADSLVGLVQRFESGAYSSADVLAVLKAGLKGGRCDPLPDLAHGQIDGGPVRAAQAAAHLLVRAFSIPVEDEDADTGTL